MNPALMLMGFGGSQIIRTHLDLDLERERDLERECLESALERAGDWAGERLSDLTWRLGLTLRDAERDSCGSNQHQQRISTQTKATAPHTWGALNVF